MSVRNVRAAGPLEAAALPIARGARHASRTIVDSGHPRVRHSGGRHPRRRDDSNRADGYHSPRANGEDRNGHRPGRPAEARRQPPRPLTPAGALPHAKEKISPRKAFRGLKGGHTKDRNPRVTRSSSSPE